MKRSIYITLLFGLACLWSCQSSQYAWVEEQNTKAFVWISQGDPAMSYYWEGGTFDRVIHGDGELSVYKDGKLKSKKTITAYYGTVDEKSIVKLDGGGEYIGDLDNSSLFEGFGVQIKGRDKYIGNFHKSEPSGALNWYINDALHYSGNWDKGRFQGKGTLYGEDGSIKEGKWKGGKLIEAAVDVQLYNGHYVGDITKGVPDGSGKMSYFNGTSYEGEWKEGKWNGEGLYCNATDSIYGTWANSKINGNVVIRTPEFYYEGTFADNSPTGNGILCDAQGVFYSGSWIDGKREGIGDMIFPNGDSYFGEWKNNQFNGTGRYVYESANAEYQGEWKDGLQEGEGSYTCPECTYFGEWEKGWMDGKGILQFKNGDQYEGTIHENLLDGIGYYQYENGDWYEGEFVEGKISGLGVFQFKNGNRFEGEFLNGKIYGDGTMYICEQGDSLCITGFWPQEGGFPQEASILFANGDIYEGPLQDGYPTQEGIWVSGEERRAKIDKIEKSALHRANEFYKAHEKTINYCLLAASGAVTAIEIAAASTGILAPIAAIAEGVNIGINAVDAVLSITSDGLDIYEAKQLGEDTQGAVTRLVGDLAVNAAFVAVPLAAKGLGKKGLGEGVKYVARSEAAKVAMTGIAEPKIVKTSFFKFGTKLFGKVRSVSIRALKGGELSVESEFKTITKSSQFKVPTGRSFAASNNKPSFKNDYYKTLVEKVPKSIKSLESLDGPTKKTLQNSLKEDSRFFRAFSSADDFVLKECEIFKESPKLMKDPNFIRMYVKSYFAKNEGHRCPIFDLIAKEERGFVRFYTKGETPALVAEYKSGVVNVMDKAFINQELIPNVCYVVKGANGKKCSFFIDDFGRISSVQAKYMSPNEITTEIINRTGDNDFGEKWDVAFKKLREASKGDDVNIECTFKYLKAEDVLPKHVDVSADINGKSQISQSFENFVKRLSNTYTAAENNALVKKFADKLGLSLEKRARLLSEMNANDGLARLVHDNPELNIKRWMNINRHVDKNAIIVLPSGRRPANADVYAGRVYYFHPDLNPELKKRLVNENGRAYLKSNGEILSYDDLVEWDKLFPEGVPFSKAGFADFSKVALKDQNGNLIKIDIGELSGSSQTDIRKAWEIYHRLGFPDVEGYTFHHAPNSTELMLVLTKIHQLVDHAGGMSTMGM